MKKFLVLVLISGLLFTGCGTKAPAENAVKNQPNSETETLGDEVVADVETDSSQEGMVSADASSTDDEIATDVPSEPMDDEDIAVYEEAKNVEAEDPVASHLVSIHKNAGPDNTADYFPEIFNIYRPTEAVKFACNHSTIYQDYEYEFEHRVFDFLVSELPDNPVEDTLTGCNMTSIGTYIRDEFLEENNLDETNSHIWSDEYIHTDTIAYQIYITEPVDESSDSINYENELKGTCILIFKTQDDPNNGVMVLYIKDMNKSDVPFLQD